MVERSGDSRARSAHQVIERNLRYESAVWTILLRTIIIISLGVITIRSMEFELASIATLAILLEWWLARRQLTSQTTSNGSRPQEVQAAECSEEQPARQVVLVVDDEPVARMMVSGLLERLGVEARTAADGEEALRHARQITFDAILMDLQMPQMDGIETARRIVAESPPSGPIIAISATESDEERQRVVDAGLDGLLTKPVSIDQLREQLSLSQPYKPATRQAESVDEGGELPLFDPSHFDEMVAELGSMWVSKVTRGGRQSIGKAREQLSSHQDIDLKMVASAAHLLKGAAANTGLSRLRSVAARLEEAALAGDEESVERLRTVVGPLTDASLGAIGQWRPARRLSSQERNPELPAPNLSKPSIPTRTFDRQSTERGHRRPVGEL